MGHLPTGRGGGGENVTKKERKKRKKRIERTGTGEEKEVRGKTSKRERKTQEARKREL